MAACGSFHSGAVSEEGVLWTWGAGGEAQLGHNSREHALVPTRISPATTPKHDRVVIFAAGYRHSAATTEDGTVLTWGERVLLGHGDEEPRQLPAVLGQEMFAGSPVAMVACGQAYTIAVTASSKLPHNRGGASPQQVSAGGRVWTWGARVGLENLGVEGGAEYTQQLVPVLMDPQLFDWVQVVMVAAGDEHAVALTEEGKVFTWGNGSDGRLGHNDQECKVVPAVLCNKLFDNSAVAMVAAGGSHTVAVTTCGALFTMGDGHWGQLGLGDRQNRLEPTRVGNEPLFLGASVLMVAAGLRHTLAVTAQGEVWSWGNGDGGRLGLNDNADRQVPTLVSALAFSGAKVATVAAGTLHSAAVTESGALYTRGRGCYYNGEMPTGLGHGNMEHKHLPTLVVLRWQSEVRIGRCRRLPQQHALAFAMVTHQRLGEQSPVAALLVELVQRVLELSRAWPEGRITQSDGVLRLLGGGLML